MPASLSVPTVIFRNHFSGGAILRIALGPGVSDEKVKERISSIVADCGGRRTSEAIRRAPTSTLLLSMLVNFLMVAEYLL